LFFKGGLLLSEVPSPTFLVVPVKEERKDLKCAGKGLVMRKEWEDCDGEEMTEKEGKSRSAKHKVQYAKLSSQRLFPLARRHLSGK
jgi:hypothetical protein